MRCCTGIEWSLLKFDLFHLWKCVSKCEWKGIMKTSLQKMKWNSDVVFKSIKLKFQLNSIKCITFHQLTNVNDKNSRKWMYFVIDKIIFGWSWSAEWIRWFKNASAYRNVFIQFLLITINVYWMHYATWAILRVSLIEWTFLCAYMAIIPCYFHNVRIRTSTVAFNRIRLWI